MQGPTCAEHTIRWELESGENQLAANLAWIERSLRLLPDDYIPVVRITQGYLTVATMFGCQAHWSEDPNQPPGVMEHPIKDLARFTACHTLTGLGVDAGEPAPDAPFRQEPAAGCPLTGVDIGGPLNNMKDLIDTNLFYTAFYDDPKAVHHLLDLLSNVQLEVMQALLAAAGGDLGRFGSLDFDPVWHPAKYISFCSDDVGATPLGPKTFEESTYPYNDRLYAPWGSGGIPQLRPTSLRKHVYPS